jgi:hypothetical protein
LVWRCADWNKLRFRRNGGFSYDILRFILSDASISPGALRLYAPIAKDPGKTITVFCCTAMCWCSLHRDSLARPRTVYAMARDGQPYLNKSQGLI